MGHCSVDRNYQIEVRNHCRGVCKIAQHTAYIMEDHAGRGLVYLPCCGTGLETQQRQVWKVRQRRQGCQGAGAIPVIFV
jgi:hypothetical protein